MSAKAQARTLDDLALWQVLCLVALGPLILVGRELIAGQVLFWGTPALQFVPWWVEGTRQISSGSFPLWNELSGMGAPLLANYQSAFFYPPNWTLFLFERAGGAAGVAWGYTLLAMLHLIWGGWGMAFLLRKLGARPFAQAVGGLAFALCGYLIGRLEFISMVWVAAWLPWVIRYTDDLASVASGAPPIRAWLHAPLIVCLAMQLTAGHAQLTWYTLELAGLWLFAGIVKSRSFRGSIKPLLQFTLAGVLAVGLAAVQLVPTAEYLLLSHRASQVEITEALTYSFWPWRLLSLFAPGFFGSPGEGSYWGYASFWEDHAYIGMVFIAMALSTLRLTFSRSTRGIAWLDQYNMRFLWLLAFTAVLLALGKNTPIYVFLYRFVPTFDMFQAPARYMIWFVFCLILLGAAGIDAWRYPSGKGLYWLRLGTAGAFAVAAGAGLGWLFLHDVRLTFIRATAMAGLFAFGVGVLALLSKFRFSERWRMGWHGAVFAWVLVDLLVAGWTLNPTVPASFYRDAPQSIQTIRSELTGQRFYLSGRFEYFLKFVRFFRFADYTAYEPWQQLRSVLMPNSNLLDQIASANNFDPFVPARYSTWMNLLDRANATRRDRMLRRMNVGLEAVFAGARSIGVRLERVSGSYGAAWFRCAVAVEVGEDILLDMAQHDFATDRLLVEGAVADEDVCARQEPKTIAGQPGENGQTIYRTDYGEDGWLYLSQVYYPGWVAFIDGEQTDLYRADFTFTAVPVPAGEHEIYLEYRPKSFVLGGLLSILMSIGFVILKRVIRI